MPLFELFKLFFKRFYYLWSLLSILIIIIIIWYPIIFAWVTISIGALLLGLLGIQLIQFQNHQEAYFEMRKDINEASNWLRQHGIDIDN